MLPTTSVFEASIAGAKPVICVLIRVNTTMLISSGHRRAVPRAAFTSIGDAGEHGLPHSVSRNRPRLPAGQQQLPSDERRSGCAAHRAPGHRHLRIGGRCPGQLMPATFCAPHQEVHPPPPGETAAAAVRRVIGSGGRPGRSCADPDRVRFHYLARAGLQFVRTWPVVTPGFNRAIVASQYCCCPPVRGAAQRSTN